MQNHTAASCASILSPPSNLILKKIYTMRYSASILLFSTVTFTSGGLAVRAEGNIFALEDTLETTKPPLLPLTRQSHHLPLLRLVRRSHHPPLPPTLTFLRSVALLAMSIAKMVLFEVLELRAQMHVQESAVSALMLVLVSLA